VRCRKGHLFTTIWIPGVNLKEVDLTEEERRSAREDHDIPIPETQQPLPHPLLLPRTAADPGPAALVALAVPA
jgi:hypothetical protein